MNFQTLFYPEDGGSMFFQNATYLRGIIYQNTTILIIALYDPEDGGRMFLRNAATYLPHYTASHTKTLQS
jgi:hypothetical protein